MNMDFIRNDEEAFNSFGGDPFGNLLDDEIAKDILDDIMNDANFNGIGFDMNSLSSEDSGRSSSSYEDMTSMRTDGFSDQSSFEISPMNGINNDSVDMIKEEPAMSTSPEIKFHIAAPLKTTVTSTTTTTTTTTTAQPIFIRQSIPTNIQQMQTTQSSQKHFILQPSNILVKQEPINIQPNNRQHILTLQDVGGNIFTTLPATTLADQTPVHTIVNRTTGILTKIPIVPVTRILTTTNSTPTPTSKVSTKKSTTKDSKKSGHNIIERRYRTSINDKITELKNLVTAGAAAPNTKMNKSGILKKSIDKIRSLEAENVELKMENRRLKELLNGKKSMSETMPLLSPPISNIASPIPGSPTSSHGGDSIHQPVNKMETDQQKIIFIQRGIAPHSKFALCIFMFAIIALNNFGVILHSEPDASVFSASESNPSRRTILSHVIDDPYNVLFSWKSLLASVLNGLIVIVCLIKLLVYGEPIVERPKEQYEKLKTAAELNFRCGALSTATSGYLRILQQLGIHLPAATSITSFECFIFTIWQIARMIVHRLPFGLWLSRKVGGLFCSIDKRNHALNMSKEIGWSLHRLNQINLIERQKQIPSEINTRQTFYGLMISLYAVNMCEIAEEKMYTREMVEVYLTAALRAKTTKWTRFLTLYYMRKAKFYHLLSTSQQQQFDWVFSEQGYKFLLNTDIGLINFYGSSAVDTESMTGVKKSFDPISLMHQEYCKHLLEKALERLLGFKTSVTLTNVEKVSNDSKNFDKPEIMEVLTFTKHLFEVVSANNNEANETISWLTHVITAATHWSLVDFENSELSSAYVDNLRKAILTTSSVDKSLLKALFVAFIAKRELFHCIIQNVITADKLKLISYRCNIASSLLQDYLTYNRTQNSNTDTLSHFIQILTCDWLLETRYECWEAVTQKKESSPVNFDYDDEGISVGYCPSIKELQNYQHDLNSMHLIMNTKPLGQSRVNLYEAIYRLMAGAAPLDTHKLLERNILVVRNTKNNIICAGKTNSDEQYVCGERERAISIYIACRYLPAQVGVEQAGLLTQASRIFKMIGDKYKMEKCYRLINNLSKNGSVDFKSD